MKYTVLTLVLLGGLFSLLTMSCDQLTTLTEHSVVFEEDLYLEGTTSAEGYFNLNDHQFWRDNKGRIEEITDVIIQYRISRNDSPAAVSANFYFGEFSPNIYLGSASIAAGATTSGLETLSLMPSQADLIDLIMRKDAFWYAVQGTSNEASIDFEPVRVTINGTFDIP